jgi:hypothetical protein
MLNAFFTAHFKVLVLLVYKAIIACTFTKHVLNLDTDMKID